MSKTFIMCKGLPGSGKTTWAKGRVEARGAYPVGRNIVRINKDDIRAELGGPWSEAKERETKRIRDVRIIGALEDPMVAIIISDDTNLDQAHEDQFRFLCTYHYRGTVEFLIREFATSIEECIRRDALRDGDAKVGPEVIYRFANRYQWPNPAIVPVTPSEASGNGQWHDLVPAIICDLDGTLSLFGPGLNDRSPYDASTCDKDVCNLPVRKLLEVYYRFMHRRILYVSGRFEKFRPQTEAFFRAHHIPPGTLWMRPDMDTRRDSIIKLEIFNQHIRHNYCIDFVLDDRDRVVAMWRALGLTCLQVNKGDF